MFVSRMFVSRGVTVFVTAQCRLEILKESVCFVKLQYDLKILSFEFMCRKDFAANSKTKMFNTG